MSVSTNINAPSVLSFLYAKIFTWTILQIVFYQIWKANECFWSILAASPLARNSDFCFYSMTALICARKPGLDLSQRYRKAKEELQVSDSVQFLDYRESRTY